MSECLYVVSNEGLQKGLIKTELRGILRVVIMNTMFEIDISYINMFIIIMRNDGKNHTLGVKVIKFNAVICS